jgi:hypothetical protein
MAASIHDIESLLVLSGGTVHNLAKVGVEGSNPFARSKFPSRKSEHYDRAAARRLFAFGAYISAIKKM